MYEPHAANIQALSAKYSTDSLGADRRTALHELAASFDANEEVAIICRSASAAEYSRIAAGQSNEFASFNWMTIDGLRATAPYDRIVVPGWLGRRTMRELSNVGFGARTDMLLLPFERRWYDKTMSAARRWERRLERSTATRLKRIVDEHFSVTEPRWVAQASKRVELSADNDVEALDDTPEVAIAETRAVESIRRALPVAGNRAETAKAHLVLFTEPGTFALFPPAGQVIVLPEDRSVSGDDERRLLFPVGSLAPGMLTALPLGADRDLIDAWADRILNDGGALRARADRWKVALKRHFAASGESYIGFAKRLAQMGERRDPLTIRTWASDTRSVAPRNYRRVLPVIAELIDDGEFAALVSDTIVAIDGIYSARLKAAEAIVSEIFSGKLDVSGSTISLDIDGHRIVYALARIERLAGIQEVPSELVGRRLHLSELPNRAGAAA